MHIYTHLVANNNNISAETTGLLLSLQRLCHQNKFEFTVSITNGNIPYWDARNQCLEDFKNNENYTHLLLLSDKINVEPQILLTLLNSKYDVSCLVAPLGTIKWSNILNTNVLTSINTIINNIQSESDYKQENLIEFWTWLHSNINIYNTVFGENRQTDDDWTTVELVSSDFMLINRNIIEKLDDTPFKYISKSPIQDKSFCDEINKYTKIWAYTDTMITKVSTNQFLGKIKHLTNKLTIKEKVEEITDIEKNTKDESEFQPNVD